jgi:hypothetical protein
VWRWRRSGSTRTEASNRLRDRPMGGCDGGETEDEDWSLQPWRWRRKYGGLRCVRVWCWFCWRRRVGRGERCGCGGQWARPLGARPGRVCGLSVHVGWIGGLAIKKNSAGIIPPVPTKNSLQKSCFLLSKWDAVG